MKSMKRFTTGVSLLLFVILISGCNQEEEFFEKEFLLGRGITGPENYCAIDEDLHDDPAAVCESSESGCQSVLDPDLQYMACIPVYDESQNDGSGDDGSGDDGSGDDSSGDDGSGDDGSGDDSSGDDGSGDDGSGDDGSGGNDDIEPGQEFNDQVCNIGNTPKILVCHVPPGNSSAAHTICISEQGWLNGHMPHHEDDHKGACTEADF